MDGAGEIGQENGERRRETYIKEIGYCTAIGANVTQNDILSTRKGMRVPKLEFCVKPVMLYN